MGQCCPSSATTLLQEHCHCTVPDPAWMQCCASSACLLWAFLLGGHAQSLLSVAHEHVCTVKGTVGVGCCPHVPAAPAADAMSHLCSWPCQAQLMRCALQLHRVLSPAASHHNDRPVTSLCCTVMLAPAAVKPQVSVSGAWPVSSSSSLDCGEVRPPGSHLVRATLARSIEH